MTTETIILSLLTLAALFSSSKVLHHLQILLIKRYGLVDSHTMMAIPFLILGALGFSPVGTTICCLAAAIEVVNTFMERKARKDDLASLTRQFNDAGCKFSQLCALAICVSADIDIMRKICVSSGRAMCDLENILESTFDAMPKEEGVRIRKVLSALDQVDNK